MIKQGKRTIKYSLAALSALLAVLCVAGLLFALYANKEGELARVQSEALALLDSREGEYDAQRIVLRGTSHKEAEKLASRLGAALRITYNGEFATLTLPKSVDIRDIYEDSENRDVLELMSPDFFVSTAELTPTRPDYSVSDTEYEKQTYLNYINIGKAWEQSKGEGVTVAVIDTGVDIDHPEFNGKISERSYNATKDKTVNECGDWSLVDDTQGHGTAVCGVISAAFDGAGTVGIAPEAELLVIKVESEANGGFCHSSDIAFGVYYAIEQGVDIINMSLCGDENTTKEATRLAAERGIICIAAAGNNATDSKRYPASDENVIGVGALAEGTFELASYSNYGENISVVAPGSVYTTLAGGGYGKAEGTSFACPAVSAAVALYISKNPNADIKTVLGDLSISAQDLGQSGEDSCFGYGVIDVNALICEERGVLTLDMQAEELEDITQSFVRQHTLQSINIPVREGYVFGGWYYDAELTKPMKLYKDIFTSDLTLYAKWTNAASFPYTYTELQNGTLMINGYNGDQKQVAIPEYIDGKQVSSIADAAFAFCEDIESVQIPTSITSVSGGAFFGASSIKAFSLSGEESESFSVLDGVLLDKEQKRIVAYPAGREGEYDIPSSVTSIGKGAFAYSKITTIDLSGITSIENYAFMDTCIQSLSIPYSVASIGKYSFAANKALTTLRVGRSVVSVPEYAFAYCTALKTLSIPSGVLEIGNYAFYKNANLQTVEFERNCSLALIHNSAFAECGIKKLSFPQSMLSISEKAFYKNTSLECVSFAEGCKLSRIDNDAFAYCESLVELDIPATLSRIGENAFRRTALEGVTLPAAISYLGGGAFAECAQLKGIEIDDGNTFYISLDGVVYNADQTSIVAYPSGKEQSEYALPSTITSIGEAAFCGAEKLKMIYLPSSLSFISREAFRGSGLTEVDISENITHIGAYAFSGLKALTEFKISTDHVGYTVLDGVLYSKDGTRLIAVPAGRTEALTLSSTLKAIDFGAFENSALEMIDIPASVNIIAADAFKNSGVTVYCKEGTAAHGYCEANVCNYLLYNLLTPIPPELASADETTLTLVAREGYEYRLEGGEWQSSNVFAGLDRNTAYTFYQREAQASHKEASVESTAATFETLAHSYGDDDICDICNHNRAEGSDVTDKTAPTDESTTTAATDSQALTDTQPSGRGCRSTVITVPIAFFAVLSLGTLIRFKKKED